MCPGSAPHTSTVVVEPSPAQAFRLAPVSGRGLRLRVSAGLGPASPARGDCAARTSRAAVRRQPERRHPLRASGPRSVASGGMAWTWRYEDARGTTVEPAQAPPGGAVPDAERRRDVAGGELARAALRRRRAGDAARQRSRGLRADEPAPGRLTGASAPGRAGALRPRRVADDGVAEHLVDPLEHVRLERHPGRLDVVLTCSGRDAPTIALATLSFCSTHATASWAIDSPQSAAIGPSSLHACQQLVVEEVADERRAGRVGRPRARRRLGAGLVLAGQHTLRDRRPHDLRQSHSTDSGTTSRLDDAPEHVVLRLVGHERYEPSSSASTLASADLARPVHSETPM